MERLDTIPGVERLDTIPGVDRRTAEVLVAESGTDMRRFPTAGHLASWGGQCPGNHESAGKRKGGKRRKGSRWLGRAVTEAAPGAARTKQAGRTGVARRYRRLGVRRGKGRAAVAVGHHILGTASYILRDQVTDHEPAPGELEAQRRARTQARAVDQLRQLGFEVPLTPKQPAA